MPPSCARRWRTRRSVRSTLRRQPACRASSPSITGRDLAAESIGAIPPVASFTGRDGKPMFQARDAGARGGARPLRRRGDRDRGRRDAASGAGRGRSGRGPLRCAPRRVRRGARDGAGRAGDLAGRARQHRARLGGRRRARRSMRRSPAPRMSSACSSSIHGWRRARWSRAPRIASFDAQLAALHADRADPGRRRGAQAPGRRRVQRSGEPDPHRHLRRGRRLRHEGAALCRVCRHDVRGAAGRAAGQMVREPAGELSHRHPRPRRAARGRAGARRATANFSACACAPMSGIGAYTSTFAAIFATANTKNCLSSVYVIPSIHIGVKMVLTDAAPLGPYRGAGRPEAIYLIERLIDRGGARDEHRSRRAAPAQPDPARPRCRTGRRTGRSTTAATFATHPGPGAGAGRLERLCGAARGVRAGRQAARHRHRLLPRGRRRHSRRNRRSAVRA